MKSRNLGESLAVLCTERDEVDDIKNMQGAKMLVVTRMLLNMGDVVLSLELAVSTWSVD